MEQQRALNALEPYIALAKSASSPRAAADLIIQATSTPQTYVFAELLQTPNIQALSQSPEYAPHLRLLEIFAWGTIADYNATPNLPPLSSAQTHKLHLLSLLPLCTSATTLNYTHLQTALSLPSPQALESLITSAIYANLLSAHLDPLHQTVRVTSVAPLRDQAPGAVPGMVGLLSEWEGRCVDTLAGIEAQIAEIRKRALVERRRKEVDERKFEEQLNRLAEEKAKSGKGQGGGEGGVGGRKQGMMGKWGSLLPGRGGGGKRDLGSSDAMDVDEGVGGSSGGSRSSKRKGR